MQSPSHPTCGCTQRQDTGGSIRLDTRGGGIRLNTGVGSMFDTGRDIR